MTKAVITYIRESGVVRYGGQAMSNGRSAMFAHLADRDIISSGSPPTLFTTLETRFVEIPVKHESIFTVNTASQQFVDFNPARKSIKFYNQSSNTIYLGSDINDGVANGVPLVSGTVFEDIHSKDAWFAISNGTGNMLVVEIY
jgi:hypothetical protein